MPIVKWNFDETKWKKNLLCEDWYITLGNEIQQIVNHGHYKELPKLYDLIEDMLSNGLIPLSDDGPNFDEERKVPDAIVVHHAGSLISTPKRLSAMGLLRQYALDYFYKKTLGYDLYGKAIWSNHFNQGEQVFYAYHWLILDSGEKIRLLEDKYIGWHAGNWDINTRSVGVVLSGNFEKSFPNEDQLKSLTELIKGEYNSIDKNRIKFHSDIVKTVCPGDKFRQMWMEKLQKI